MPRSSLARATLRTPMQARERERVQRQIDEAQFGRAHLLLKVDAVRPNPRNPRKVLDQSALNALADSIKQHVQLQPVVVRKIGRVRTDLLVSVNGVHASALKLNGSGLWNATCVMISKPPPWHSLRTPNALTSPDRRKWQGSMTFLNLTAVSACASWPQKSRSRHLG
jgi:hypothetical protein